MERYVAKKRGRPPNPSLPGRDAAILAYYRDGHTIRQTAEAFNRHPSLIGRIVRGERPKAQKL